MNKFEQFKYPEPKNENPIEKVPEKKEVKQYEIVEKEGEVIKAIRKDDRIVKVGDMVVYKPESEAPQEVKVIKLEDPNEETMPIVVMTEDGERDVIKFKDLLE